MKKLIWIVMALALIWFVKLSLEIYTLSNKQTVLEHNLAQIQQQNANLNDQVAALKRRFMGADATTDITKTQSNLNSPIYMTDDTALVRQQLDLIEFALQQQQYAVAIDKLNQLERVLSDYELSAAMREGLQRVISKDRTMLKQYVANEIEQNNKLKELLRKIDREITQELAKPYQQDVKEESSFWQRMIRIEPTEKPSTVLMQRAVILKEAQLRLIMAQNALQQGQRIGFVKALDATNEVLKQLPDQQSKVWIEQIKNTKSTPVSPLPTLNTRTLIGA